MIIVKYLITDAYLINHGNHVPKLINKFDQMRFKIFKFSMHLQNFLMKIIFNSSNNIVMVSMIKIFAAKT